MKLSWKLPAGALLTALIAGSLPNLASQVSPNGDSHVIKRPKTHKPDTDDNPQMMEQLERTKEQLKKRQEENDRRKRELEAGKAAAPLPPQGIEKVELKIQALTTAIATTGALLAKPLPATKKAGESYLKQVMSEIAYTRTLESAVSQDLGIHPAQGLEAADSLLARLGHGESFKTWRGDFDQVGRPYNPDLQAPVAQGPNTHFFGIAAQLPPSVIPGARLGSAYTPTTVEEATAKAREDHGLGGGVMLEGTADGLGPVKSVLYDGSVNALILNSNLVYFVKIPPWSLATICREIGTDRNALLGVSETPTEGLVFGDKPEIYKGSDLAYELMLADRFLADVIFARPNAWTQGYRFPTARPAEARVTSDMLVRFAFRGFRFADNDGQLSVIGASLEVRMLPVSKAPSPTGQMLPNYNAMEQGWTPPAAFLANARILTENIDYFRREPVIDDVFAYGETAAVLRSLKASGRNLNDVAAQIETGGTK